MRPAVLFSAHRPRPTRFSIASRREAFARVEPLAAQKLHKPLEGLVRLSCPLHKVIKGVAGPGNDTPHLRANAVGAWGSLSLVHVSFPCDTARFGEGT
jgi:hypothetical protein